MAYYFRPYEYIEDRYIFVSYSHKNSEQVLQMLNELRRDEFRIWYDEGIAAGADWPLSVQTHLKACDTVIFFMSECSMSSENCFSEIKTAKDLGKKIICVHLDDAVPEGRWVGVLDGLIHSDDIVGNLDYRLKGDYFDPVVPEGPRKSLIILLIASIVFLATAIVAASMIFTGKLDGRLGITDGTPAVARTPIPTVDIELPNSISFPDSVQEKAVRYALDVSDNEGVEVSSIPEIKELYICGNMPLKNADDMEYDEDGNCRINGAPVQGNIDDLSFVSQFAYLEKLYVTKQNITDISKLSNLKLLTQLDISGNPISSLEGVSGFISLESLNIEHTNIRDLTPLTALPGLKKVYVSKDMLPLTIPENAKFEIVLVK